MVFETEAYKRLEAAHVVEFEEGRGIVVAGAYYTPDPILKAIRDVMGEIDIDPSSCKCAQRRIQAKKFYDKNSDGLHSEWHGRAYVNPDYNPAEVRRFVLKAHDEYVLGRMTECIFHLHTSTTWQQWFHVALDLFKAFCFVSGKVEWTPAWEGYEKELKEFGKMMGFSVDSSVLTMSQRDTDKVGPYTEHGSLFAYLGPNIERFTEVFSEFGTVLQETPGV